MMKNYKKILLLVCLTAVLVLPPVILAAEDLGPNPPLKILDKVGSGDAGPFQVPPVDSKAQLAVIIGTIVGIALSFLGIIFLLLMIFAGYNWMTAQGEEEKVSKAKDTIARSIIGLIIVLGSYAIWKFILSKLF